MRKDVEGHMFLGDVAIAQYLAKDREKQIQKQAPKLVVRGAKKKTKC